VSIAVLKFEEIRRLVREEAGIYVERGRTDLVDARLLPLTRRFGASCIDEFVDLAIDGTNPDARRTLVEAMADHETAFFRDPAAFEWIKTHVLPGLLVANEATKTLRIWCAGTSGGQEAYSMAILLAENFPELAFWNVDILATDLSESLLAKSREGVYSRFEVNRGLPAAALVKYFDRRGLNWEVKKAIRDRVAFRAVNLAKPFEVAPKRDLVLLRYVLPTLDPSARPAVLERVRAATADGGRLVLGANEPVPEDHASWARVDDARYLAFKPAAGRQESR
jgi:chemotaxis protein methyltransferase CheR